MPAPPGVTPWDLPPVVRRGPGVARRILDFHLMTPDLEVVRENDESILQKVGAGDERAFSQLYDRFSGPLFGLMRQMLDDERDAEDVLQDGFVYLWEKASSFDAAKSKAFTWAVMIFRNKAIDRLRARGRRSRLHEAAASEMPLMMGSSATGADEAATGKDRASLVRKALLALPAEQRRLVEFAFFKGETHQAIAETLGVPLGTVKTNIRRGLLRLRDILKGAAA
jgi:RNA polymerase sigma-70 factor, ECF subfamily